MSTVGTRAEADRDEQEMSERGRTVVAGRAVERLAAYAVTEIESVGGSARRLLGVTIGAEDQDRAAGVQARVDGATADLDVRLSIAYPNPVAVTCERVRVHLIQRVAELAGLTVSRVDITVTALHAPATGGRLQ
ncbi:putative alkaline shock family protein YloU [Prauserella shujinwangii]|uniref:Putative alkaline shock family protein YloU n=1 Tax=Prauserella shujinwangii TaxID=1453103 RepID=A0A2T0M0A2_9PSEU|nr:Asp23/Gls24 family envelope stress response protein [Prauserella shujinwangii]PRX50036.1 putative alkaline shock family protein YloU [Prauserella shujinwangii]